MSHSIRSHLVSGLGLLGLAGLLGACTAFFPPDEDNDEVARCDNVGDCDAPANSRWDVECVHADGQDSSTPKVCAPKFREVSCDPGVHDTLQEKYDQALAVSQTYISCTEMPDDNRGKQGCQPQIPNMCDGSLDVNALGVCDEPGATYLAAGGNADRAGKDVLDSFCRNYFCDKDWMCDDSSGTPICRPCQTIGEDGQPALGSGGCAELWVRNETGAASKSSVYKDDVSCGGDGLSSDPNSAIRMAAEAVGEVPDNG